MARSNTVSVEGVEPAPPPKIGTTLTLVASPPSQEIGKSVRLRATLLDTEFYGPVAGKTVQFLMDYPLPQLIGTATTNVDGVASLTVTVTETFASYYAEFLGDDVYEGCP